MGVPNCSRSDIIGALLIAHSTVIYALIHCHSIPSQCLGFISSHYLPFPRSEYRDRSSHCPEQDAGCRTLPTEQGLKGGRGTCLLTQALRPVLVESRIQLLTWILSFIKWNPCLWNLSTVHSSWGHEIKKRRKNRKHFTRKCMLTWPSFWDIAHGYWWMGSSGAWSVFMPFHPGKEEWLWALPPHTGKKTEA